MAQREICTPSRALFPHFSVRRNIGFGLGMLGIDQVEDKTTKAPIIGNVSERIFKFCIERGVIVRPVGSRIIISPPLIFSSRDCDTLISALNESIMAFVANR